MIKIDSSYAIPKSGLVTVEFDSLFIVKFSLFINNTVELSNAHCFSIVNLSYHGYLCPPQKL